ncbi:MAG: TIM barrel protein [bacterium]
MSSRLNRREWIGATAALGAALTPQIAAAQARRRAETPGSPPPYTISINIEIMFPRTMSRADRVRAVAAQGFKAYSYWHATDQEVAEMIAVQKDTGIKCCSIVGTGDAGSTTGFTMPGQEQKLLDEFKRYIDVAQRFPEKPDLVSFVGAQQKDVPWEKQRAGIVEGLRKAGELARQGGVYIVVEPVSDGGGRAALSTTARCYPIIEEVNHPNVRVCFDFYHLQRTEGNLVPNMLQGFEKKLIRLVQIGDNPGRCEPGTGEINYAYIFRTLRKLNYTGYLDTEMGSTSTAEYAMAVTRQLAYAN